MICFLNHFFEKMNEGELQYHIGLQIHQNREKNTITVNQINYLQSIVESFNIEDSNTISILFEVDFEISKDDYPSTLKE